MVVAQEAIAARIGADILQQGGNAVDAAVAVGFALAVTYPRAGNLGGGGFMLIHRRHGNDTAIDYRETAPAAITDKTFLDANGNADPQKSRNSALAIGVPGTVAGLALRRAEIRLGPVHARRTDRAGAQAGARRHAGRATTSRVSSANELARLQALAVDGENLSQTRRHARSRSAARLVQSDLADTLEAIAKDGPHAFYDGPIADKIAAAVQAAGGVMTADDLKDYRRVRAHAGARHLSRLRHRLDAAAVLGRRRADRDAQHPRRLRSRPPGRRPGGCISWSKR